MPAKWIRTRSENGSFALEFALVAPFAIVVLALVLMGGSVATTQIRAQALATSTAIALARGESSDALTVRLGAQSASSGLKLEGIEHEGGVVCAVITEAPSQPGGVPELMALIPRHVSARACCPEDPA